MTHTWWESTPLTHRDMHATCMDHATKTETTTRPHEMLVVQTEEGRKKRQTTKGQEHHKNLPHSLCLHAYLSEELFDAL